VRDLLHNDLPHNKNREGTMLELYHNINSVCAQKVRIALAEKGQQVTEHLLTLQGDQNDPAYMKLNPNGVVPTLVHDGNVIIESSLILYYIDEAFDPAIDAENSGRPPPGPALQQADRRIHAQRMHDHDFCYRFPASLPQNEPGGVAGRDQQGAAQAPRRIQTQCH
jgi:glutathione S-transferase